VQPPKIRTTQAMPARGLLGIREWVSKFGKGLSAEEVDSVARAFLSLAQMDTDFSARADLVADAKRAIAGAAALGEPART
jgi:hypothetical protein